MIAALSFALLVVLALGYVFAPLLVPRRRHDDRGDGGSRPV